jgi:predicted MPP superfamily phosphohydrolase
MYLRYTFIFIVFLIVIITGEYLIYLSLHSLGLYKYLYVKNILLTLGILFPVMFVGSMFYGGTHFSVLNSWIYTASAVWLGLLTYLVITALVISILVIINNFFGLNIPTKQISIILLAFAFATTIYGVYNANSPKVTNWEVNSPALSPLWKGKKIVFISDTHLGMVRQEKFMKKVVDIINKEKPDIAFNLGDLIDGPSFPYAKGMAPLNEINAPMGSYYVEGNHERYSQEYDLFKSNFPEKLNDITNKKVIVNGTQIIGIPFASGKNEDQIKKELDNVSYDKTIPSIILMHDPKDTPMLASYNASLVLSGHTHAGQFFPFTFLLDRLYGKYAYGVNYIEKTVSITSNGVGTAMPPLRVGTTPEIVVVTFK